jgi:hypothetical protein
MALLKQTLRMLVVAAMMAAGTLGWADEPYHPFAMPMSYNPDWQFFAPVDIQQLEDESARQRANVGWYLTYDRINIGLDRPVIEVERNKLDRAWGNLWTFGVMTEDDHGWDFQFLHVTGPNHYETARILRPVSITFDSATPDFGLLVGRYDFDLAAGNGTLVVKDSLNVANFGSFEMNKTWRTAPYRLGGTLEPLIGLRYADFTDYNVADGYSAITDPAGLTVEQFDLSTIKTQNRMLLGQIGFRYFKNVNRFTLSSELKLLGGGNWQTGSVDRRSYLFGYDGDADPVLYGIPSYRLSTAPGLEDKLVAGLDTKIQVSYCLTRQINFRAGVSMLYLGSGIARGSQIRANATPGVLGVSPLFGPSGAFVQQNLVMPGFSVGMTINR